jgi:3-methylcrotonyl-CoA carboxylase alpha subunit
LADALGRTQVVGPATNLGFLRRIAWHPAFAPLSGDPDLDTRFIERHRVDLLPEPSAAPPNIVLLAALATTLNRRQPSASGWQDPWSATDGWRLNGGFDEILTLTDGDRDIPVTVRHGSERHMTVDGVSYRADGDLVDTELTATIDGKRIVATYLRSGLRIDVLTEVGDYRFTLDDPIAQAEVDDGASGSLASPMPGKIVTVLVSKGDVVTRGQALLVLEAMKMEHTVKAPADGTIGKLPFAAGDQVDEGVDLIGFESAS